MIPPGTLGAGASAAGPPAAALVLALVALLALVFLAAILLLGRSRRRRMARDAGRPSPHPPDRRDPWQEAGRRARAD